jgi:hypothetical protein
MKHVLSNIILAYYGLALIPFTINGFFIVNPRKCMPSSSTYNNNRVLCSLNFKSSLSSLLNSNTAMSSKTGSTANMQQQQQMGNGNPNLDDDSFIQNEFQTSALQSQTIMTHHPHVLLSKGRRIVGPSHVIIYCTTLRDGTQGESVSISCDDKLKIATRLASFGVDYIEAGWPGSNPKDAEFFSRATIELSQEVQKKLVAFGSTRRKNIPTYEDGQIQALVQSGANTICIVAKAHVGQVTDILRATPQENLQMIYDSISYLIQTQQPIKIITTDGYEKRRQVFVDLEHFFDGYKLDSSYAIECCKAAVSAGATSLVLCDTNGGTSEYIYYDSYLIEKNCHLEYISLTTPCLVLLFYSALGSCCNYTNNGTTIYECNHWYTCTQ